MIFKTVRDHSIALNPPDAATVPTESEPTRMPLKLKVPATWPSLDLVIFTLPDEADAKRE